MGHRQTRNRFIFFEQANSFHSTIKFTAEISEKEITFLDTVVYKGERFQKEAILDIKTHYKPTETFQYTHNTSCHPPGRLAPSRPLLGSASEASRKVTYLNRTSTKDLKVYPPGVKRGFIKGKAIRLLRTNSSQKQFLGISL